MNNDNLTPVTEDTFMAWKEKRKSRKLKMSQKVVIAQTGNKKKQKKGATGRAIFAVDPSLNTKDAEGASDAIKRPSEDEGEGGDTTHVHIDADEEERVAAEILEIQNMKEGDIEEKLFEDDADDVELDDLDLE